MRLLVAGLAAGTALLAGCAAPSAPPLSVALDQSRDLENRHLLAVRLTNDGDAPVDVVRLQLRSGAWSSVAPTVREEALEPGRRLAFPVPYGRADCARPGSARLVVGYRTGGQLHETEVAVPADDPLLPRLHRRECDLAALARSTALSFTRWTRRGEVAVSELVVQRRRGGARAEVVAVDGSVIFTLRATGPLDADRVPVEAAPTRCDPHALAESKRTYDFAVAVSVEGAEPLTVTVRPRDVAVLQQLVEDVCL